MAETLLLSAAFSLAAGTVYTIVGRVVHRRPVTERHSLANALFAMWWIALGISTLVGGAVSVLAYRGVDDLQLHFAITLVNALLICVGLLGLLYYLIYLFTGARNILPGLVVGYVLYYFLLVYYLLSSKPVGVDTNGWGSAIRYESQSQGPLFAVILVLLIVPQILGSFALLALAIRIKDREQKFRAAVVSLSIILWFGSALVVAAAQAGESLAWQITSRFIGLGAALAILLAYQPPAFIQRRLQKAAASSTEDEASGRGRAGVASATSQSVGRSTPSGTAS